MTNPIAFWSVVVALCAGTALAVSVYIYYGRIYIRSHIAGTPVPLGRMIRLSLKGVNAHRVVTAYLDARVAGIEVSFDELEDHALARGDVRRVVNAVIATQAANRGITVAQARSWDLRGQDPLQVWERSA